MNVPDGERPKVVSSHKKELADKDDVVVLRLKFGQV